MNRKISITVGLPNVEYKSSKESKELKSKIEEELKKELFNNHKIIFYTQKKFKIDLINHGNNFGFAFAISKFDDKFTESSGGFFRYKTKEVNIAIRKIVSQFGLNPSVKYDRGMGVFVYNMFI